MKIAFLIAMFLAASTGETEENNVRVVSLMGGVEMEIREIQFPRILPTAYYDQALSSIPGLYPDSEIVAKYVMDTLGITNPLLIRWCATRNLPHFMR
tara:strand:+ start:143 stop:433 length:291 start_codon:yes stop_codon:yes gene_type:complete